MSFLGYAEQGLGNKESGTVTKRALFFSPDEKDPESVLQDFK